jgi:hypothetical protein
VTVVVEGAEPAAPDGGTEDELDAEIRRAVGRGESKRDLARAIGKRTGRPARDVYARAVAIAKREPKG